MANVDAGVEKMDVDQEDIEMIECLDRFEAGKVNSTRAERNSVKNKAVQSTNPVAQFSLPTQFVKRNTSQAKRTFNPNACRDCHKQIIW